MNTKLMVDFCNGNEKSFALLMEKNFPKVINTIKRFTGNQHDAEDLAQEVFLRIYNARNRYVPSAKFTTWLYHIVTNLCLNYVRDRKRHRVQALFKESSSFSLNLKDSNQKTPSNIIVKEEMCNKVRELIQTLPPNQRLALILSKYEGLSYKEISEVMETSLQAVKSLINRGKVNLKNKLKEKAINKSDFQNAFYKKK